MGFSQLADKTYLSFKDLDAYKLINMETCTQCGVCSYACPAHVTTEDNYAVPAWKGVEFRRLLVGQRGFRSAILGRRPVSRERLRNIASKGLYLCSLCGRCIPGCVFTIQNLELWETLRSIIYEEGEASPSMMKLDTTLEKNMNPYDLEHGNRLNWTKEVGPKGVKEGQRAKTLYYVGCTSSYQEQTIAASTATVLNKMNEDWSLFGKDEWCCGDPYIAIGNKDKAKEFAKHNLEVASSLGATKIVTACAHCYRMWKFKYPEFLGTQNIEIVHTTEYLQDCLKSGRLKFENKITAKITYHDPCHLARLGDIVKEPRHVLGNITETYVDMKEKAFDTFCCGGGGMIEAVNKELWTKIGDERFKQAKMVNPQLLVSACPFCRRSLKRGCSKIRK